MGVDDREEHDRPRLDRREFLRQGSLAGIGLGLLPLAAASTADAAPRVERYVPLGRTGLEISDIGFGSSQLKPGSEGVVLHAFDRGVNYFDTADSYLDGNAERMIGSALKGKRDQVILTSKFMAQSTASRREIMSALEGSLRRLQTDHLDVFMNHAVNDLDRLRNSEWGEFVGRAKEQGKIRFAGMSGHGGNLIECIDYAIEHDLLDVLLSAYNFAQDPSYYEWAKNLVKHQLTRDMDVIAKLPEIPSALSRAKKKGVGVIVMKTLLGGRLNDLRQFETRSGTFSQAAFRWVLSNPSIDALIVSMKRPNMIDEYLLASGSGPPRSADFALLRRYEAVNGSTQCQYGCSACADSCPQEVPISDVMRARMYEVDYGSPELARSEYALLGAAAGPCSTCVEQPCLAACPKGLEIGTLTKSTHRMLDPKA